MVARSGGVEIACNMDLQYRYISFDHSLLLRKSKTMRLNVYSSCKKSPGLCIHSSKDNRTHCGKGEGVHQQIGLSQFSS